MIKSYSATDIKRQKVKLHITNHDEEITNAYWLTKIEALQLIDSIQSGIDLLKEEKE